MRNNFITADYANNQTTHHQTGIYFDKGSAVEISCNDVNYLLHGFRFFDKSSNVRFWDNWMHIGNQNGFTLDGNGQIGIIGLGPINSSEVWCRSNNHWDGTSSSWNGNNHARTNCIGGSNATNSPLYVSLGAEFNPDGSSIATPGLTPYALNTTIITTTPNPNKVIFCQRCTGGQASGFTSEEQLQLQELEEIAVEDPDAAPTQVEVARWSA